MLAPVIAADCRSSIAICLVIVAVRFGSREADGDHPYGHRRFETIATVILGMSLLAISTLIVWHVMGHINQPETLPVPDPLVLGISVLSIAINEWLFHYTKAIAKKTRSKLLLANAWHQRSDALSSLVVLFGVCGVLLGYPYADIIAASVVALMVGKMGLGLIGDSIKELVDTALPSALVAEIRAAIMLVDGVKGIHLLRTRQMGEDAYIDAHIVVDSRISVSEGHCIGDAVRDALINRFDDIIDVLVHVDPEDDEDLPGAPMPLSRQKVHGLLAVYFADNNSHIEDFRIHYLDGKLELEILLPFAFSQSGEQLALFKQQCQMLKTEVSRIDDIWLFFITNEV